MAREVFREPESRDKLADAKTMKLVPRLPFQKPSSPLPLKRNFGKRYSLLLNKFEVLYNAKPSIVELILNVALTIEEPVAFIQPTQVRKLEKKIRKLAKEIEAAESTEFLLAVVREQYEKRLTTMQPLSLEAEEILKGPRVARIQADINSAALQHAKGQQKQGNQVVNLLLKRAAQYRAWLESVKDKAPARARRLGQLKLLYFGFYMEYVGKGSIPYRDIVRLLECIEGFPRKIDDSKYRKDIRAFMMNCKDSWSLMYAVFSDFDPLPHEKQSDASGTAGPITHPSQYRIMIPKVDDPR